MMMIDAVVRQSVGQERSGQDFSFEARVASSALQSQNMMPQKRTHQASFSPAMQPEGASKRRADNNPFSSSSAAASFVPANTNFAFGSSSAMMPDFANPHVLPMDQVNIFKENDDLFALFQESSAPANAVQARPVNRTAVGAAQASSVRILNSRIAEWGTRFNVENNGDKAYVYVQPGKNSSIAFGVSETNPARFAVSVENANSSGLAGMVPGDESQGIAFNEFSGVVNEHSKGTIVLGYEPVIDRVRPDLPAEIAFQVDNRSSHPLWVKTDSEQVGVVFFTPSRNTMMAE